ncbi:MAG TPA: carboxypeptidase-like regulatory domain-containing protein, partial [Pyrinomonadaceae bacterium]|nr:carboxypeptidase-like regulatory domain-containing protein [Pyrinomonadaceae bacterium]
MSAMLTFAQDTSGKLVGSVSDDNGAVPNATVVVTNKQTGGERTLQANGSGNFDLSLEFGVYSVKITATGYKTTTIDDVKIDLGRDTAVNAKLQVGDIAEVVTVTSTGEQINSTNAELSSTIGTREIRDLPLNTRNPLGLLNLLPGVNATTSSINGQRSSATAFTRDGLNVQDNFIRSGAFVSDQPTVDDTGEFTVTTQNAGVEGGGGTTQVQLVTPRGGKDFHGNLFAFNRNSKFAANSFFGNTSGLPRAFLNRNQYGGSISGSVPFLAFNEGGPVIDKNKLFFFFNYEAFRLAQQAVSGVLTTLLP